MPSKLGRKTMPIESLYLAKLPINDEGGIKIFFRYEGLRNFISIYPFSAAKARK